MTRSHSGPSLNELLRRPGYRRLWLAGTISQIGDVAQFTTPALLIVMLTGSSLGVTAVVLAEVVGGARAAAKVTITAPSA